MELAMEEYRHFMLLFWINQNMKGSHGPVVPTSRAESIHLLHFAHGADYRMFIVDTLLGYIDPLCFILGLRKGTQEFTDAVAHTKRIHEKYGVAQGFCREYPLACDASA